MRSPIEVSYPAVGVPLLRGGGCSLLIPFSTCGGCPHFGCPHFGGCPHSYPAVGVPFSRDLAVGVPFLPSLFAFAAGVPLRSLSCGGCPLALPDIAVGVPLRFLFISCGGCPLLACRRWPACQPRRRPAHEYRRATAPAFSRGSGTGQSVAGLFCSEACPRAVSHCSFLSCGGCPYFARRWVFPRASYLAVGVPFSPISVGVPFCGGCPHFGGCPLGLCG